MIFFSNVQNKQHNMSTHSLAIALFSIKLLDARDAPKEVFDVILRTKRVLQSLINFDALITRVSRTAAGLAALAIFKYRPTPREFLTRGRIIAQAIPELLKMSSSLDTIEEFTRRFRFNSKLRCTRLRLESIERYGYEIMGNTDRSAKFWRENRERLERRLEMERNKYYTPPITPYHTPPTTPRVDGEK